MKPEELDAIEARAANSMNGDYHADALALVAEVRRLREAQQWRTMDSAPKDGTWVELYRHPLNDGRIRPTHIFAKWFVSEDGCASWCWPDDSYEVLSERGREDADHEVENGNNYESTKYWLAWRHISTPNPMVQS